MSKFDNLFNSIIITERRTIHTFEDWVDWVLTVEDGQAVTFTKTPAYKEIGGTLDQPGSIIGNFNGTGEGPLNKEALLKKKPITVYADYEDANGNRQGGHISVYSVRPIGGRGPRYK